MATFFVARSGWRQGDGTAKENDDGADSAVAAKEKGGEGRMASYKAYLKDWHPICGWIYAISRQRKSDAGET